MNSECVRLSWWSPNSKNSTPSVSRCVLFSLGHTLRWCAFSNRQHFRHFLLIRSRRRAMLYRVAQTPADWLESQTCVCWRVVIVWSWENSCRLLARVAESLCSFLFLVSKSLKSNWSNCERTISAHPQQAALMPLSKTYNCWQQTNTPIMRQFNYNYLNQLSHFWRYLAQKEQPLVVLQLYQAYI